MSEVKLYCLTFVIYFYYYFKTPKETLMKKRIVIFASGSGTNTQNLIQYFQQGKFAEVVLVLSNKKDAKVLDRAKTLKYQSHKRLTKESLFAFRRRSTENSSKK